MASVLNTFVSCHKNLPQRIPRYIFGQGLAHHLVNIMVERGSAGLSDLEAIHV